MKPQLTERSDVSCLAECDPTPSPMHPATSMLGVGFNSRSELRSLRSVTRALIEEGDRE